MAAANGPPIAGAGTMCSALSQEASELAALLRALQDDFSAFGADHLPDNVLVSAQSLDRVCQTLDDFGAIFERLASGGSGLGLTAGALSDAVAAARQEHLRRRLLSGDPPAPTDPVEFF